MAKKEEVKNVETEVKPRLNFKVKKNLTLPLIKLQLETPVFIKFLGEMFVGKDVQKAGEKKKEEPAILANVINLETGEECQIIINSVVKGNLTDDEDYKDGKYVGKSFMLIKHDKREGKRYNDFTIQEIEVN